MKRIKFIALFMVILLCICINPLAASAANDSVYETVILSLADDPYYTLAQEISATEGIPIYQDIKQAADVAPVYLLWVISPGNLSESVLMDFSHMLSERDTTISVGIISGRTIEDAHRLWKGSVQIPTGSYTIINGTKESKIEPEILYSTNNQIQSIELTKENVLEAIESTNIIQISLEGAAGSWFDQHLGVIVQTADIPNLNGCVIQNYGCSTFKPWADNSIALECVSKGAAAYCGFVYSSLAGTRFGDYTDSDALYTWEGFPLGHLVQIQNRAAMQSYANSFHYFMLGDPRIYCRSEAPYQIVRDEENGDTRKIQLSGVENGLIPIVIKDGAEYDFISISGLTASSMDSAYFNNKLQMMDINGDKYIIVDSDSDILTINLARQGNPLLILARNALGFLDYAVTEVQGSSLPLLLGLPLLVLMIIGLIKMKYARQDLFTAAAFGTAAALIVLLYVCLRMDIVTVTNIPVRINGTFIVSIFIYTAYGALLAIKAKKPKMKILSVLAANLYPLVSFIMLGGLTLIKLLIGGATDINKWGYPWLFPLQELIAGVIIMFAAYNLLSKLAEIKKKNLRPTKEE